MATAGPLPRSSCWFGGIHSESSIGLRAGGCDACRNASSEARSPAARMAASAQGRKRRQAGAAGRDERVVVAGDGSAWATAEIADRRPEDSCGGIASDEPDDLAGASSAVMAW